jgi:hypothetical protein
MSGSRSDNPASSTQKERERREIAAQVEAYLRRGGRIRELSTPSTNQDATRVGSVWHDWQDLSPY